MLLVEKNKQLESKFKNADYRKDRSCFQLELNAITTGNVCQKVIAIP